MEEKLLRVALRQRAVFVPAGANVSNATGLQDETVLFAANLAKLGFGLIEELLHALDAAGKDYQEMVFRVFRSVMNIDSNWTPLVKAWQTPTGQTWSDVVLAWIANIFQEKGPRLPCGHIIPQGTFPLERYNGCPLCGKPFVFGEIEVMGQNKSLKVLERWDEDKTQAFFQNLLKSKTALDATQVDSLKMLLTVFPLPQVEIGIKETLMVVIDQLIAEERADEAGKLFKSPTDVLRYLWYKHTGFLQIVEPKIIVFNKSKNSRNMIGQQDQREAARASAKKEIKLKYGRKEGIRVAKWLNALPQDVQAMAEIMHPKREMWVRFIRALRLAEYAKRPGFEKLAQLLDVFYREDYPVWQGKVQTNRLRKDPETTMALLRQRPGLFARSLFANMLWFGPEIPLKAFAEIIDQVPARLVFTLSMYAEDYFLTEGLRTVKPLGGTSKSVPRNPLLSKYSKEARKSIVAGVQDLAFLVMRKRFAAIPTTSKSMYIDLRLFEVPVSIGDRSDHVQDMPTALMGTRFPVLGGKVRLFMQWGTGLPATHLDMDLSCGIVYPGRTDRCSYYSLTTTGCQHSGDIQQIPDKIGTAEYIEMDLVALQEAGAKYAVFTCNAYTNGALSPNMSIGWMGCEFPMHVSNTTGVAYDPSCVQHQVRIKNSLSKGLIFGVMDVPKAEIVWLELPFAGQTVEGIVPSTIEGMLAKLNSKLSVGNLLALKAEAQGLQIVDSPELADESYDMAWVMDTARVTQLLVD